MNTQELTKELDDRAALAQVSALSLRLELDERATLARVSALSLRLEQAETAETPADMAATAIRIAEYEEAARTYEEIKNLIAS